MSQFIDEISRRHNKPEVDIEEANVLSREVSIFLDAARIVAALLVFAGHCDGLFGNPFGVLGHHAPDAVAIFFVISGFVICYVATTREQTAIAYARARAVRIYSVAMPALAVTFLADILGLNYEPAAYVGHPSSSHSMIEGLIACLTFSGEFWSNHTYFGTNEPYWSIDFEVWYYILFGIVLFLRPMVALVAASSVLILIGPTMAAFAPLWLLGAATYHLNTVVRLTMSSTKRLILTLISLLAAAVLYGGAKQFFPPTQAIYHRITFNFESLNNFLFYTSTGLAFALILLAVTFAAPWLTGLSSLAQRPVRWLSGATFTLYLAHLPIVYCLYALTYRKSNVVKALVILGGTISIVLLLAEIGERRKRGWEQIFQRSWRVFQDLLLR
jgi:peptidoglycan/LPS O-acetylase OafA/YrhL